MAGGRLGTDRSGDDLLARLPLPLAQLYRRALNAKSPQDRHHNAYYLAEATLKLSACLRIGAALAAGLEPRSPLARSLETLCLPAVGHWVAFLREATLFLRARSDSALLPLALTHEQLLEARSFPPVQAFAERAGRSEATGTPAIAADLARDGARQGLLGFFNLIGAYRNQVFGHGAQRLAAFYEELGPLLLGAVAEVLREDCLFGGLALAVARSAPDPAGRAASGEGRLEWQGLEGLASLLLAEGRAGPEPERLQARPGQVYFVGPGTRVPLHPLVIYQEDRSERERVGFLNRSVLRGGEGKAARVRRVEYLDYATGDILLEADARDALGDLLGKLRSQPVVVSDVDQVIEGNRAEPLEAIEAHPPAAGETIGDFTLEGELGRGGMGVVYLACQRSLNRRVALKVLPPGLAADPVSLARFRREIAALARADHPNLVKILTSGSDGDRHFYAMELLEGTDLAVLFEVLRKWKESGGRALRESDLSAAISSSSELAQQRRRTESLPEVERIAPGPQPVVGEGRALHERLAVLFAEAAEALAHLHARGILHRDVKPGNLMLTQDGARLVVMDLGLAQVRDRSQSLTRTGMRWVGTLRYAAPEQLQWNLLDVDERADVYGLGASLYELVTLSPLFDGDTEPRLIEQVLRQEPRAARKVEPAVPRDLEAVVMGCLDKDRERRYANARDLAEDLRRFSKGVPVRVRPVTATRRLWRWCRRNPALAAASALAMVCLLSVAIVSTWFALRAQYRLAESHLIRGQLLCQEGEIDRGLHWMARALEETPPGSGELREVIRMNLSGWRSQWTPPGVIMHSGANLYGIRFSPDSRHFAVTDLRGTVLWSIDAGEERMAHFSAGRTVENLHFSPDGKLLLAVGFEVANLWSLDLGTGAPKLIREWSGGSDACFHPDGRRVFIAATDGTARTWSVEPGGPSGRVLQHSSPVRYSRFSRDGRRVLAMCADGTVWLWESESGEALLAPLKYEARVNLAELSPDGSLVLTGSGDGTARLWSAETGAMVGRPLAHEGTLHGLDFSPDGKRVLTLNGRSARWWSLETHQLEFPALEHEEVVVCYAFSRDGRLLLTGSGDRTARLWSMETGEPVGSPRRHEGEVRAVEFSEDGRWIVTMSEDAVRVWPVEAGRAAKRRFEQPLDIWGLAFAPDGKKLLCGDGEGRVQVWTPETGSGPGADLVRESDIVWAIAFSPDGKRFATASGSDLGMVRFWSAETGERLPLTLEHPFLVREVAFSPDGKKIATACADQQARIWSTESGKLLSDPLQHGDIVEDVAFSPDGKLLLTGSGDGKARLWSVGTGAESGTALVHQGSVLAVAFSPDGTHFATGSRDRTARLWSVEKTTPVGRPLDHPAWVEDLEFSRDGALILTGCADGAARLWSVATGHLAGPPLRNRGRVVSVAFAPDGKRFAVAGSEIQVRDIFSPLTGDSTRVRLFTEAATGLEMDEDGVFHWLDPVAWRERRERAAREEP